MGVVTRVGFAEVRTESVDDRGRCYGAERAPVVLTDFGDVGTVRGGAYRLAAKVAGWFLGVAGHVVSIGNGREQVKYLYLLENFFWSC